MVDVVAALEVAVGPDPSDLNSLPRAEASWTAAIHEPQLPSRVAWSPNLGYGEVDAQVLAVCQRAVEKLASMGAEVVEVDTVFDEDPIDDWLILTGTYNLRTFEALRETAMWDRVDPFLKMLVEGAESLSALDIVHAEDHCHHLNLRLVELFHDVRLLISPTTAGAAPLRSLEGKSMVNGEPTLNWVQFTYPFNMTRSPAASICAGLTDAGLPVGLQLVGPQHGDLVVLRSAAALEEAIGFEQLAPS
jgi:aspartyl-tRNA(Asn)/glutamyl-tRNA(Gln) amidotransferase subunit A